VKCYYLCLQILALCDAVVVVLVVKVRYYKVLPLFLQMVSMIFIIHVCRVGLTLIIWMDKHFQIVKIATSINFNSITCL